MLSLLPSMLLGTFGGCTDGITCGSLFANGFKFDCRFAEPANATESTPSALMLHGFPEWSEMYMPLMRHLVQNGIRSVACNQRGYSPGARPPLETDYNYEKLRSDVFALATANNYSKFHLVGHDHGALLGWVASASDDAARILTYTALSIPHATAFSNGLFGPDADVKQQVASQYFSMFMMNNSASLDLGFWFETMGKTSSSKGTDSFESESDFQRSLWWYNGAFAAGYIALPPLFSATDLLLKYGSPSMASLREAFSGCDECKTNPNGKAMKTVLGNVSMPALYVCGASDPAILCNRPFALKTSDYCSGSYTFLEVKCGHDVLKKGIADGCSSDAEVDKVNDAVLKLMESVQSTPPL